MSDLAVMDMFYEDRKDEQLYDGAVGDFYNLSPQKVQQVRHFNVKGRVYTLNFKNMHQADDLENLIEEIFDDVLERIYDDGTAPDDHIGVWIEHEQL